jgi:hypothetical protein
VEQQEILKAIGIEFGDLFIDIEDGDVVEAGVLGLDVVLRPEELYYAGCAEHHNIIIVTTSYSYLINKYYGGKDRNDLEGGFKQTIN